MLAQCLLFVAVATWIMVLTGEASGRFEILIILAAALFPILMTAFACHVGRLAVDDLGIYFRAPKQLNELGHWTDYLVAWDDLDFIQLSRMGFGIHSARTHIAMLPPFCFVNWDDFESMLRKHRPEFFKRK